MPGRSETAFLGLGGNVGRPDLAMAAALQALDADPGTRVDAVSSLWRTPPWGVTDQPDFLNAVARITTAMTPHELLAFCLDQERAMHRVRDRRWGPRPIDIDILLYGDAVVTEPNLTIPHPRIAERAFILVPLEEVAPDLRVGGEAISDLARKADASGMMRVGGPDWWRPVR